ncbi:ClpP/crotonase-like domain-containing protein [Lipomyces arxii]|uniref:ClpP/crotonase-like domain-containing protein n=1 Tax=Lipomyces arxii TaxID=56418 RepID=UPI0034CF337F
MADYAKFSNFKVSAPAEYVLHVEINRPKKMNAFNQMTWSQLRQIFEQVSLDSNFRVVLLSGVGDHFTSGLELSPKFADEIGLDGTERGRFKLRTHIRDFQDAISSIEKCSKPVVGIAHGLCYGLAVDILCATDIRICTADVRFSVKEVDIGLAADIGTLQRLPKIVRSMSWVKEVVYTSREFGASEAEIQGLVSRVVESRTSKIQAIEVALDLAKTIAKKSPVGVQGSKYIVNYSEGRTIQDGLDFTAAWNAFAIGTDMVDAVKAKINKKPVKFSKL